MVFPTKLLNLRQNVSETFQYVKRLQEKYVLHRYWNHHSMEKIADPSCMLDVDIGEAGRFKYILIEISKRRPTASPSKWIIRADASCACHSEIFDKFLDEIDQEKLNYQCCGGGRIRVDPATLIISIYGYSEKFGRADHKKTLTILREKYSRWTVKIIDEDY